MNATAQRPPIAPAVSGMVHVETPELVVLSYTIAGVGSRAYAALIDYLICLVVLIAAGILAAVLGAGVGPGSGPDDSAAWAMAVLLLLQFAVLWGYYVLWEALADGQTPGKRSMRLRVVRDGGYSVDFGTSAVRNLIRFVDMQPVFTYGIGLTAAIVSRQGKRLGDVVAGTIVVREEVREEHGRFAPPAASW